MQAVFSGLIVLAGALCACRTCGMGELMESRNHTVCETASATMRARIWLLLTLILALALRLHKLGAEAFWYDEVISLRIAACDWPGTLIACANDSTPPLYFLGLKAWQLFVPSTEEAAVRGYSLLWSMADLVILCAFAFELGCMRVAVAAALLAAANPLHIYYAQELRMYSQAAALATASSWLLWRLLCGRGARRALWCAYAVSAWLLLLTHYVALMVLLAQGCFAIVLLVRRRDWPRLASYLACTVAAGAAFSVWYAFILVVRRHGFNTSNVAWITLPPPLRYVSFLWNEFFWGLTTLAQSRWRPVSLALAFMVLAAVALMTIRPRENTALPSGARLPAAYLLTMLFAPPLLAAVASRLYVPLYDCQRFSLFLLSPFLMLAGLVVVRFRRPGFLVILAAAMFVGTLFQKNVQHKPDWRGFARVWKTEGPPMGIVVFPCIDATPASWYAKQPVATLDQEAVETRLSEWAGKEIWVCTPQHYDFALFPWEKKYHDWLMELGPVRAISMPGGLSIQAVRIGGFDTPPGWHGPFKLFCPPHDITELLGGLARRQHFYPLEKEDGQPVRWSLPKAAFKMTCPTQATTVVLCFTFPPPLPDGYRPDLRAYSMRGDTIEEVFAQPPAAAIPDYAAGKLELAIPVAAGKAGVAIIGWTLTGVNPARHGATTDDRDLGLRLYGIALAR